MTEKNRHPVVLYDEECALCNFWVRFLLRYDRRGVFHFAGQHSSFYQSVKGKLLEKEIDIEQGVVLFRGDTVLYGVDVVWDVLRTLGGAWRWLTFFSLFPAALQRWVYGMVARNRYRLFGRYRGACRAGSVNHPERFLQ